MAKKDEGLEGSDLICGALPVPEDLLPAINVMWWYFCGAMEAGSRKSFSAFNNGYQICFKHTFLNLQSHDQVT